MAYTQAAPYDLAYEFPAELDEFLECCIEEYGDNWELISLAFLDIADGLDPMLAERANSFFSPATLQQRWLELSGSISDANETLQLPTLEAHDQSALGAGESHDIHAATVMQYSGEPAFYQPPPRCKSQALEECYAALREKLPTTLDAEQVSDISPEILPELSDNSSDDEDFTQARRSIKSASGSLVASQAPMRTPKRRLVLSPQGGQNMRLKDPAWSVQAATRTDPVQAAMSKPYEAIIVEQGYQAEDPYVENITDEENDDDDDDDDDFDDNHAKRASIRAIRRLLRCAPSGECMWSVWLEATREWPRLPTVVGNPDFCQQGSDLKVRFDLDKMHQVLQSEQNAYAEYCQEQAARLQKSAAEFIQETEKRREMVGKALGGFFLTPRNPELERKYGTSQLAKI